VAKGIVDMIKESFRKDLAISCKLEFGVVNDKNANTLLDVVNAVATLVDKNCTCKITYDSLSTYKVHEYSKNTIFFLQNSVYYGMVMDKNDNAYFYENHIVYAQQTFSINVEDLSLGLKARFYQPFEVPGQAKNKYFGANFLYHDGLDENIIHHMQLKLFTENTCSELGSVRLNEYHVQNSSWKRPLKVEQNFENFHGCPIIMMKEYENYPNTLLIKKVLDVIAHLHNATFLHIDKNHELARLENFDTLFDPYRLFFKLTDKNITKLHPVTFKPFMNNLEEFGFGLTDSFDMTKPYGFEEIVVVVTPGDLYTSFEKILLPFDETTWYYLIITFSSAFLMILVINLLPLSFRNIVYGVNVQTPAFNVIGTFFGIGQIQLPRGNFGRIILLFYIMFCLVIRTAYQGVQFEMLTKEMRRPPVQTLDEIFDKDYKLYICGLQRINQ
jgi:hypothetical protein